MATIKTTGDTTDGALWRGGPRLGLAALVLGSTVALAAPALADVGHRHADKIVGGQPGKKADVTRTVRLVATDNKFNKKMINVKAGDTIRFIITNKGEQVHDFTLGTKGVQTAHRKSMEKMMGEGMDPMKMDHKDPNAVLLRPGETKELIWRFTKARNFEFGCNIPGHYEDGMKGRVSIR